MTDLEKSWRDGTRSVIAGITLFLVIVLASELGAMVARGDTNYYSTLSQVISEPDLLVVYGGGCSSNAPIDCTSYTNYSRLYGEHLTNTVKRMAKDGEICAVLGHKWMTGGPSTGWAWLDPQDQNLRTCMVCGLTQRKTVTWEDAR